MTALKNFYLMILKIISTMTYQKNLNKNKVTIIVDFEEDVNEFLLYTEKEKLKNRLEIAVFYHPRIKDKLLYFEGIEYREKNIKTKLQMIKYMQSSLFILVDNYLPELGAIKLNPHKICIQIWHANGALKKFGLAVPAPYTKKDIRRFKNVYRQYDALLVGSNNMKDIFKEAFHIQNEDTFLKFGALRMDKYFRLTELSENLRSELQQINPSKIILYTPTYRENAQSFFIDFNKLNDLKQAGYLLILRTHPTVNIPNTDDHRNFVLNGNQFRLEELIQISDILITDYSSIAMEFSIMNKPIYFFTYDLREYKKYPGLIEGYKKEICSEAYEDIATLQMAILNEAVNVQEIETFNAKWNTYTTGNACASLVNYMESRKESYEVTLKNS